MKKTTPEKMEKAPVKTNRKKSNTKKRIHAYVIALMVWLVVLTCAIFVVYSKFNSYITHYEEVYQSSLPYIVSDDVFSHFSSYDVDYIWENMTDKPRTSQFESDADIKEYIHRMIDGKEMTYKPSNKYSDAIPSYVVEADGFVVAEFSLCKDLNNPREFGFPTWVLKDITYYTEAFETIFITAPSNFNVYVNGVLLDESYICSEDEIKPDDESYLLDYGTMPGMIDYYIADLFLEPEVAITDMFGDEVDVSYNEETDIYSTGYTDHHVERDALEEFAINYTITFANVISRDESLSSLEPYFPEGSALYDSISRNTALLYFMAHSNTTIENEEIREFISYSEDVVYIEVYIEQHMTVGYNDIQVVPTTARIYCVKVDGEWKVISMRF